MSNNVEDYRKQFRKINLTYFTARSSYLQPRPLCWVAVEQFKKVQDGYSFVVRASCTSIVLASCARFWIFRPYFN